MSPTKNTEQQIIHQQQIYTGPIPPASELEKFKNIHKELPNRIMSLAEEDAKHVREHQKEYLSLSAKQLESAVKTTRRGQWFAFIIMILFLVFGFTLIILNKSIPGTIFGSVSVITAISSVIYMFIFANNQPRGKDRPVKRRAG